MSRLVSNKEVYIVLLPKCCGNQMEVSAETSRFVEVQCKACGDVVFVKKEDTEKPQLLDD